MKIIFDKSLAPRILRAFGKTTDQEGYLVDENTKKRIISKSDDDEIRLDEFAGIAHGSEAYLKSDIVSLIKYVESGKDKK